MMINQWEVPSKISMMKIECHLETEDFTKKYTFIYNMLKHKDYSLRLTVWLGKAFKGFTNLNRISDYGRPSGYAFADWIIIPF